ncbi:MAG: methionine adenosyltransferase, partial [Rhodothalassiaceae bacterium]
AAGRTTPGFGGGRVEEPMRLVFGDRAVYEVEGRKIPVEPILVEADVRPRPDGDGVRLSAKSLQSLDRAAAQSEAGLDIVLADARALPVIREILDPHRGGRGRISFLLDVGDGRTAVVDLAGGFRVTPPLRSAIANQAGVIDVMES